MKPCTLCLTVILAGLLGAQSTPRLVEWERGVALQAPEQSGMSMYLWFYEWNMFEAVSAGQHTQGTYQFPRQVDARGAHATLGSPALRLTMKAVPGGADLSLRATNLSDHDWPELAAIIPCWNPGRAAEAYSSDHPFFHVPLNPQFADSQRERTFFVGPEGLAALASRAIHFNAGLRARLEAASDHGQFVFTSKWPTSEANAKAGLLIRESEDHLWVTGIGWADYLSVQGHNPWNCMHVSIRVGPLRRGQSKAVRGRAYLFPGTKADCLARFAKDFQLR